MSPRAFRYATGRLLGRGPPLCHKPVIASAPDLGVLGLRSGAGGATARERVRTRSACRGGRGGARGERDRLCSSRARRGSARRLWCGRCGPGWGAGRRSRSARARRCRCRSRSARCSSCSRRRRLPVGRAGRGRSVRAGAVAAGCAAGDRAVCRGDRGCALGGSGDVGCASPAGPPGRAGGRGGRRDIPRRRAGGKFAARAAGRGPGERAGGPAAHAAPAVGIRCPFARRVDRGSMRASCRA